MLNNTANISHPTVQQIRDMLEKAARQYNKDNITPDGHPRRREGQMDYVSDLVYGPGPTLPRTPYRLCI